MNSSNSDSDTPPLLSIIPNSDEVSSMENSKENEIVRHFIWRCLADNPFLRREDKNRKEKSIILSSDISVTIIARHSLPSGIYARQIFDWILQKALKELNFSLKKQEENGSKKEVPDVIVAIPSDPVEAFMEITGHNDTSRKNIRKQLKEFVKQFNHITDVYFSVMAGKSKTRVNMFFITAVRGWLGEHKEGDDMEWRTTANGRPSSAVIKERENKENYILLNADFVQRVLMKKGSHHSIYPIDKNILNKLNLLESDIYRLLSRYLWQACNNNGQSLIPWDSTVENVYDTMTNGDRSIQSARKRHIKEACLECVRVFNASYPNTPPIRVEFNKKGIEVFCSQLPTEAKSSIV